MVIDALMHRLFLAPIYESSAVLWRPFDQLNIALIYAVTFVLIGVFVSAYRLRVRPKSLGTGIAMGAFVGLALGISSGFGTYNQSRQDPKMIGKTAWHLALTLAVLSTIGCDRVTKHAAATFLSGLPSRSYLADTVRLGYVENTGGFLSLGAELPSAVRTGLFTVGTGLLLCMLVFIAIRRSRDRLSTLGLALFVAGGASNWIDRVTRGTVVDFLNVGVGPVRTGVFNVADVAIMLGAGVIVMATLGKKQASSPPARAADTA